jgi:hypothetical protein
VQAAPVETTSAGLATQPQAVAATTTTTTTTVAPTTTTEPPESDFMIFQRAYEDGHFDAYDGMVESVPKHIWDMFDSNDPADYGYATGFVDGSAELEADLLEMAALDSAAPATTTSTTTTTAPPPPPAPTPAPSAPAVVDRGYEQGKADGELAGNVDGLVHSWNANLYVVGQGPEYTRGFHEAYDYWYSVASERAAQHEANEHSRAGIQGTRDAYDEAQRQAQELSDNIVQIDRN